MMDILKARKRAKEEKEMQAGALTSEPIREEAPKEAEEIHLEEVKAVEQTPPVSEQKPKKPVRPAPKGSKKKKDKSVEPDVKLKPPRHTPIEDIPRGARAPEEVELEPHEVHELFGTSELPELPEVSEEEISPNIELGDASFPMESGSGISEELDEAAGEVQKVDSRQWTVDSRQKEDFLTVHSPLSTAPLEEEASAQGEIEARDVSTEETPLDFLSFMIGDEEYGVPLQRINEIIKPRAITEVPRAPSFVLGILTLRGVVIPVFDLAKRLALGHITIGNSSRIVIVNRDDEKVGLLVDRVRGVARVLPRDIEPPPPVIAGVDMQFLEGVGRAEGTDGARKYFQEKTSEEDQHPDKSGLNDKVEAGVKPRRRLLILLNLDRVTSL
jgi:purine-binding chemotaxis protein CheW